MAGVLEPQMMIIVFLLAFIVFVEIRNWKERKDLMNRLFARDLPELVNLDIMRAQAGKTQKVVRNEGFEL